MPNVIRYDTDYIARDIVANLNVNNSLLMTANKTYQSEFTGREFYGPRGQAHGEQVQVRLPNYNEVLDGLDVSGQETAIEEKTVPLKLDIVKSVYISLNGLESTFQLPEDQFAERFTAPAAMDIAAACEAEIVNAVQLKANYTAGSPSSDISSYAAASQIRAVMSELAMPTNKSCLALSPKDYSSLSSATTLQNNYDTRMNREISRDGWLGRVAGFDTYENQSIALHTAGTSSTLADTITINGAVSSGSTVVVANAGTTTFLAGDTFTVSGCYSFNKRTKKSTGRLMTFVIQENVTAVAGAATLTVSPEIVTTGPNRNVSNALGNGEYVNVNSSHIDNIAYSRDGIIVAMPKMVPPFHFWEGVKTASSFTDKDTGMSVQVLTDGDIGKYASYIRVVVLMGITILGDRVVRAMSKPVGA